MLTSGDHRFGTDALLLTAFCEPKRTFSAADLCAGCGIVWFGLWDRGMRGPGAAVELDGEGAALMRESAALNGCENLTVKQADLRTYRPGALFDLVTANPPYFEDGPLPPEAQRAAARHEVTCSLPELCGAAGRLLKDGGRFCLCYPPARLAALFGALCENRLEPKRLQFVKKDPESEPWLALVDARKNGGRALRVLPDRVLPPGQPVAY